MASLLSIHHLHSRQSWLAKEEVVEDVILHSVSRRHTAPSTTRRRPGSSTSYMNPLPPVLFSFGFLSSRKDGWQLFVSFQSGRFSEECEISPCTSCIRADVLARSKHDRNHSLLQRTWRRRCDLVLGGDEWILSLGSVEVDCRCSRGSGT